MFEDRPLRGERRRLETEIQSILLSFERAREWADLTGCLNKLHKALSRPPFSLNEVPYPDAVARRLGQCLNPTLPSGVHTKCLEVYSVVFTRIQTNGLSQDLGLWSSGLFPIFQDAATHVKPVFLDIIDNFYIPLKERLLPCLTGLLVCILPGIDDSGSVTHQRVVSTLKKIADTCVGLRQLISALWTVLLRTPRVRLPALKFLIQILPAESLAEKTEDHLAIYLPHRDSLILRAIERLFEDESVLVKRELFDILIKHIPLNSHIFLYSQKVRCLRASFQVLAFREWSLTRRFLTWITDQTDILEVVDLCFFKTQVRDELCSAICEEFEKALTMNAASKSNVLFVLKIVRILLAEIEELGSLLLQKLTVPILKYTKKVNDLFSEWSQSVIEETQSILTANIVVIQTVWASLEEAFEHQLLPSHHIDGVVETLQLGFYFLNHLLNSKDADASLGGIQDLTRMTAMALKAVEIFVIELKTIEQFRPLLEFALNCLTKLRQSVSSDGPSEVIMKASENYLKLFEVIVQQMIQVEGVLSRETIQCYGLLSSICLEFIKMNPISPTRIPSWCHSLASCQVCPIQIRCSITETFLQVLEILPSFADYFGRRDSTDSFKKIAQSLWSAFGTSDLYNQIANLLLELHKCHATQQLITSRQIKNIPEEEGGWAAAADHNNNNGSVVLDVLMNDLSHHLSAIRYEGFHKFSVLWQYSHLHYPDRLVFPSAIRLALDCLDAPEPSLRHLCRSWLSNACQKHLPHVVDPLFDELLSPDTSRTPGLKRFYKQFYDVPRVVYIFGRLTSVLHAESHHFLNAAQSHVVSDTILTRNNTHTCVVAEALYSGMSHTISAMSQPSYTDQKLTDEDKERTDSFELTPRTNEMPSLSRYLNGIDHWGYGDDRCVIDYVDLCCVVASRFIQSDATEECGRGFRDLNLAARSSAMEFLKVFIEMSQNLGHQRRKEIYQLLAPPFLSVLAEATKTGDSIIQIQTLDILKLLLPIMTKIYTTSDPDTAVLLEQTTSNVSHLSAGGPTKILSEAWTAKLVQLNNLNCTVSIFCDLLPALLLGLDTLGRSKEETHSKCLGNSALNSVLDFILYLLPLIQPSNPEFVPVCEAILREICLLLIIGAPDPSASGIILSLLRALDCLVQQLSGSPAERLQLETPSIGHEIAQPTAWAGLFAWGGAAAEKFLPSMGKPDIKHHVLKTFISPILAAITVVNKESIRYLHSSSLNSSSSIDAVASELSKNTHTISAEMNRDWFWIKDSLRHILFTLFEKIPEDFVFGYLLLKHHSSLPWSSQIHTIFEILMEKETTSTSAAIVAANTHLLTTLKSTPTTLAHTDEECDCSIELGLARLIADMKQKFIAKELLIFDFIYSIISMSQSLKNEIEVIWSKLFDILDTTLHHSKDPMAILWIMSCIQKLDQKQPSRESCFNGNIKRNKKNLLQLGRQICNMANRQFHLKLQNNLEIDLEVVQLPSNSMSILQLTYKSIYTSFAKKHGLNELSSDLLPHRLKLLNPVLQQQHRTEEVPNNWESFDSFVTEESDPVEIVSRFGLAAIITLCRHLTVTQRRTVIAASLLQVFVEEIPKTILPTVMMKSANEQSLETLYLGLLMVEQLPITLFPFCFPPCKKLVHDFIFSPAFGGSSSTSLFAKISGGSGVQLFKGFDRRCLKSLGHAIKVTMAEDNQQDNFIMKVLTAPHVAGIFTSRELDLCQRAFELKRLSFFVFSCPINTFQNQLTILVEKIVESLRSEGQSVDLHIQAFFLLRVLLLRISPSSLASIWPVILTELIKVFTSVPSLSSPFIPKHTLRLILSVLKVVDIAVLLDIPDFHLNEWVFILETSDSQIVDHDIDEEDHDENPNNKSSEDIDPSDQKIDLIQQDSKNAENNITSESFINNNSRKTEASREQEKVIYEPLCGRLGGIQPTNEIFDSPQSHYRRPLITIRNPQNVEELAKLSRLLNRRGLLDSVECTVVDVVALERSMEDDLLDWNVELFDWGSSLFEN